MPRRRMRPGDSVALADPGVRLFLKDARGQRFGPPLLWAEIAVPGGAPVTVATMHYPRPIPASRQAAARAALAAALARIDRGGLIIGGDMNLTPWSAAM